MELQKDSYFQRVEVFAKTETQKLKLEVVYPEVLAYAVIISGPNIVTKVLALLDVDIENLLSDIRKSVNEKVKKYASDHSTDHNSLTLSSQTKAVLQSTKECCLEMGDPIIGSQHLLLALLKMEPKSKAVFKKHGIVFNKFRAALKDFVSLNNDNKNAPPRDFDESKDDGLENVLSGDFHSQNETSKPQQKVSQGGKDAEILTKFCRDLNSLAAKGKLDPVIGREKEMHRIMITLSRRKKNNPILIGEPGVGKTSIIEGIAQKIVVGSVSQFMRKKRIFALNLTAVVGKSQYRGQFEEKMRAIISIFSANPDYVLFIDEVHTLLGAGSSIGGLDAANILKPALASGEIKCIGATTEDEYRKYFKKDGALERRFQKITVEEPSSEETRIILEGIKPFLEKHHGCTITDDAMSSAVEMSHKYVIDRHFPDKAIDCLDEACANHMSNGSRSSKVIDRSDVIEVIADQANVSKSMLKHNDTEKVALIGDFLRERVFGQDEAVAAIVRILKNARSGVRNHEKPIGSFIFGGSSGCGKTYLAEQLAEGLFDSPHSLIRINLSEFSEKHHQSKLIGSPPGYIGFGEKNQLADRILKRPYSLVLLDGIDHAHPDVLKLFLPVLSNGLMTDAEGQTISFRNAVIVMTMGFNAKNAKSTIGFEESKSESDYDKKQNSLVTTCKKKFDDEFVNRVDEFVPFSDLGESDLEKVASLLLDKLSRRLDQNHISLTIDKNVPRRIVEMRHTKHGHNAKPLERIVSKDIETIVSDEIMKHPGSKQSIRLSVSDDKEQSLVATSVLQKNQRKYVKSISSVGA